MLFIIFSVVAWGVPQQLKRVVHATHRSKLGILIWKCPNLDQTSLYIVMLCEEEKTFTIKCDTLTHSLQVFLRLTQRGLHH